MSHKTKTQRRAEAAERNAAWAALSDAEKLARLDERPGLSTRQRMRIGLFAAADEPAAVQS